LVFFVNFSSQQTNFNKAKVKLQPFSAREGLFLFLTSLKKVARNHFKTSSKIFKIFHLKKHPEKKILPPAKIPIRPVLMRA
jgi:hypothetical protein